MLVACEDATVCCDNYVNVACSQDAFAGCGTGDFVASQSECEEYGISACPGCSLPLRTDKTGTNRPQGCFTYDGELAGRRGDPKAFLGQKHAVSARTSRSLGCGLKRRASQLRRHRRHAVPPGRPSSAAWLGLGLE